MPQGWTPEQIKQFQDYWDTEFAGDLAKRRRAKFVPGDTAVKVHQTKEPPPPSPSPASGGGKGGGVRRMARPYHLLRLLRMIRKSGLPVFR